MAFTLGNITRIETKKKIITKITQDIDVILYDGSNNPASYDLPVAILVDRVLSKDELEYFKVFLAKRGLTRIIIINSCRVDPKQPSAMRDIKRLGVTNFYKAMRTDIESNIPECCNIVTFGPALYALLMENDIYVNHVRQYIFGKTSFIFSKDLTNKNRHRVFPVDSIDSLFVKYEVKVGKRSKVVDCWKESEPCDSFISHLADRQLKNAVATADDIPNEIPEVNKIRIKSKQEFYDLFYEPNKDRHDYVAWDTETSGLDFMKDEIGCITLSFDGITGYYIPWCFVDKEKLNEILSNNKQILANGKFDIKFLWKNGVPAAHVDEDVIILGHVMDETRDNSLKSLAFYYSMFGGYERELDEYKVRHKNINYLEINEDILCEYAMMDAIVTYQIWENLLKHMRYCDEREKSNFEGGFLEYPVNMEKYYYERRIPVANMYAKIEYEGLYINKDKLDALRQEMKTYIKNIEYELFDELKVDEVWPEEGHRDWNGHGSFDWSSNKKLGTLLIDKCGWEELGYTPGGDYQVTDFQFDRWKATHKEAEKISLLKSLYTLFNAFVGNDIGDSGWPQYMIKHDDGTYRIHANYKAMSTDSGRTKCSNPNFQNIPTRGLFSKEIKGCLCSPNDEEYYVTTIDYSSLQMRLATIDCNDKNLSELFFTPGSDAHSKTAYLSFFADKEVDVEIIEVEQDGKTYKFLGGEQVLTENRGEVFARDLLETDKILS